MLPRIPQDRNIARVVVEPSNTIMEKTYKESVKREILLKIENLKEKIKNEDIDIHDLLKIQSNINKCLKNDD